MMKRSPLRAEALTLDSCRLKLVARNGVGYDHLDVEACTRAGVMVAITPEAVRRPVASANVALMLAFAHRIFERDRRTRDGAWGRRWENKGIGLQDRVLGVIGLGNIGQEIFRLMQPWGMIHLGVAPNHTEDEFADLGTSLVSLDTILAEADFLCICCPLSEKTFHQYSVAIDCIGIFHIKALGGLTKINYRKNKTKIYCIMGEKIYRGQIFIAT